jgi:tripartite-type tricarboxylate transporter receptor subunit TctC
VTGGLPPAGQRAMNMRMRCATALLSLLMLASPPARADAVADFYRGKVVNLIVGYGPGGGYDLFARMMARYLGKYIPGNPSVVVQSMAGAGSLRAANYLYGAAPKNGLTIGTIGRDVPLLAILGTSAGAQFDPRKLTWLGSSSDFSKDAYILMARSDAAVKSIEDARRPGGPPLVLGGTGEGSTGTDIPGLLRDTLGLNIKLVMGYPDNGAIFLAIDRGELSGRTVDLSTVRSLRPEWLGPNSRMRSLVQFARATRHPDFADVPTARELALNDKARALIEFAELPYKMSRPFVAPPNLPADRAKALQTAFVAVHKDPQYLEEAAKLGVEVSPLGSDEALKAIEQIAAAPPDILDQMRKLFVSNKSGG